MSIRFAFAGFRHSHIFDVVKRVAEHPDTTLVAACEADASTRAELADKKTVSVTHDDYERMLKEVPCDVIAVGDVFARRGPLVIRALQAGKHVLSDKPICTALDEWEQIRDLSRKRNLVVGCMLDLRGDGGMRTARRLMREGRIGPVQTATFHGQHAFYLASRPKWYFQSGLHGGTINDLGVHGIDAVRWMTGQEITEIIAARTWNAKATPYPYFHDCAQVFLRLSEGGGVLGDVSYLAPDGCGRRENDLRMYPPGWRFTFHGTGGMIETFHSGPYVVLARDGDKEPQFVEPEQTVHGAYFLDFLSQVHGRPEEISLTTDEVLRSSYVTLLAQRAADKNRMHVGCEYR